MIERRFRGQRLVGFVVVLGLHGLVFAALAGLPAPSVPPAARPVFVSIIDAPSAVTAPTRPTVTPPRPVVAPPRPVTPAAVPAPATPPLAAAAPAPATPAPAAPVSPAPVSAAPQPVSAPPAAVAPPPAAPLALGGELEVVCTDRPPPTYPLAARRRGVAGRVVLQVELDEAGRVAAVATLAGSGSRWLDEAARDAVVRWRCAPPQQGGVARRVLAKQTFIFSLEDA